MLANLKRYRHEEMNISSDKDVEVEADLAAMVLLVEMKIQGCSLTEQIPEIIKLCIIHILIGLITPKRNGFSAVQLS